MRILSLLTWVVLCQIARQVMEVVTAFTVSSNLVRQPLAGPVWNKHATATAPMMIAQPAKPLFAIHKNNNHVLRRRLSLTSLLRKCFLRLVAATLSLMILCRPLPALAAAPAKQSRNRHVVPIVSVICAASVAGLAVGKKLDARKSAKENENDLLEPVATQEEDEEETEEEEEEEKVPKDDAKEAERLRAKQLVLKTLKEIQEADRKAILKRSEPEEPPQTKSRGRKALSKLKSSMSKSEEDTVAEEKVEPPETPEPPLTKEPEAVVPPPEEPPVPQPLNDTPKNSSPKQPMFMNKEKSLQAKYAAMESDEERAFNILLDLGMVERTPDPDDPNFRS